MYQITTLFFCALLSLFSLHAEIVIVGIAGGSGSGKTTLAKNLQEQLHEDSLLISQDAYYKDLSNLSDEERTHVNFDHPNALDFDLLREHLIDLKAGKSIKQPIYSFKTHTREPCTKTISPAQVIILEGILIFAVPAIRELCDFKIFIDADDDIRLLRRIDRDLNERGRDFDSVSAQYLESVKPMHDAFVEPSKTYADVIIPRGGKNEIALSVLVSKLKEVCKIELGYKRVAD